MRRLKHEEVKVVRDQLHEQQGRRCAVCSLPVAPVDAVLDHHHGTGAVRGVLHRGCNSLLGKVENNAGRYGVRDVAAFTSGIAGYLRRHMINVTGLLHPTHKSPDEKRELRNKRARVSRAKKKESA